MLTAARALGRRWFTGVPFQLVQESPIHLSPLPRITRPQESQGSRRSPRQAGGTTSPLRVVSSSSLAWSLVTCVTRPSLITAKPSEHQLVEVDPTQNPRHSYTPSSRGPHHAMTPERPVPDRPDLSWLRNLRSKPYFLLNPSSSASHARFP